MDLPSARRPLRGSADVPPSKSITHRALVAAALADRATTLRTPLDAEDTRRTAGGLELLGAGVRTAAGEWIVTPMPGSRPTGRASDPAVRLEVGASGTTLRLLLALAAAGARAAILDGSPRLRERPIGAEAAALRQLGVRVRWLGQEGFPPVEVQGPLAGGTADLDAGESSQYLSALLLAAPAAAGAITVRAGNPVSRPYVDLTAAVLGDFGVPVESEPRGEWRIRPGATRSPGTYAVEGDVSAAAFLLAAGAVTGGRVVARGVGEGTRQGDVAILELLARMGCAVESGPDWLAAGGRPTRGLTADLAAVPDLVPPLAAVALFAPGPSRFSGLAHLRLKESDRIDALAREISRLGARAEQGRDFLEIRPGRMTGAVVSAHDDHRIAMAMAVAALALPGMGLDNPACVAKSWPGFFTTLRGLL